MKPKVKADFKHTFHWDGSVSYWDVFLQQWRRQYYRDVADEVIAAQSAEFAAGLTRRLRKFVEYS